VDNIEVDCSDHEKSQQQSEWSIDPYHFGFISQQMTSLASI